MSADVLVPQYVADLDIAGEELQLADSTDGTVTGVQRIPDHSDIAGKRRSVVCIGLHRGYCFDITAAGPAFGIGLYQNIAVDQQSAAGAPVDRAGMQIGVGDRGTV